MHRKSQKSRITAMPAAPALRLIIFALLPALLAVSLPARSEAPEWVGTRPQFEGYYTGIGTAPVSDKNHAEKAKAAALADLIRDISVTISSDTHQNAVQKNDEYSEVFDMEVQSHSDAYLEGHELVGTYDDGADYWCCYRLSRKKYEEVLARRMAEAASKGYDLGCRATEAAGRGDMTGAVALFAQGLETVAPFTGRNLTHNGQSVENMLEHGVTALLGNIAITLSPTTLEAVPMSSESYPVSVTVTSGGRPAAGLPVAARFTEGAGKLTTPAATDSEGRSTFTVSDVASREPVQNVLVSADLSSLLAPYRGKPGGRLLEKYMTAVPQASLRIDVKTPALKAWCQYKNAYDDPAVLRAISSFMTENYFDLAPDADSADVLVDVTVEFRTGATVKGEMYDMREGLISSKVELTDRATGTTVASFGVDDIRTLAPEQSAESKLKKQAARELLRKLKPEMKRRMASTRFSRRQKAASKGDDEEED